jgi:hypothetical protein
MTARLGDLDRAGLHHLDLDAYPLTDAHTGQPLAGAWMLLRITDRTPAVYELTLARFRPDNTVERRTAYTTPGKLVHTLDTPEPLV